MSRELRLIGALTIIFVVPLTLILSMMWGFNLLRNIEPSSQFIAEPTLSEPSFTVYSHYEDTLTEKVMDDKVYLAHFFNPSCAEPCAPKMRKLYDLQYAIAKFKHFRILSHSQEEIKDLNEIWSYGRKISNFPSWHFVYTDSVEIAGLMTDYGLSDRNFVWGSPEDLALVDRSGQIRGYYNVMDSLQFSNLVDDIVFLLRKE